MVQQFVDHRFSVCRSMLKFISLLHYLTFEVPISERSKLTIFGSNHHYLECIKAALEFSSKELVSLIKDKYDLIGRLRSIKHYLLLDQELTNLWSQARSSRTG